MCKHVSVFPDLGTFSKNWQTLFSWYIIHHENQALLIWKCFGEDTRHLFGHLTRGPGPWHTGKMLLHCETGPVSLAINSGFLSPVHGARHGHFLLHVPTIHRMTNTGAFKLKCLHILHQVHKWLDWLPCIWHRNWVFDPFSGNRRFKTPKTVSKVWNKNVK